MFGIRHFILRSLWHYRRINFAVALGVAAATAVLTGALIVGDSMRGSLRQLAIQRLGAIDDLILSDGFFSTRFAEGLAGLEEFQAHYRAMEPAIFFPGGSVEVQGEQAGRASSVSVLGVRSTFWNFASPDFQAPPELDQESAIINQALADRLEISGAAVDQGAARITVRIPKQHALPADSPMAKQDDLVESLVDLRVVAIVPNAGLGGFSLFPSQVEPSNVFLSLDCLQESLQQTVLKHKSSSEQANLILLAGKTATPPAGTCDRLLRQSRPDLEDLGLSLKRMELKYPAQPTPNASDSTQETILNYVSLTTNRLVFSAEAAAAIQRRWPEAKPVFTYLANETERVDSSANPNGKLKSIPFSMVTAIDFDASFSPRSRAGNRPIAPLADDEIVLVDWAAQDLDAKLGDRLRLRYFEPETTHGDQVEQTIELKLVEIARLTKPETGYVNRRGAVQPAQFAERPEITNDPDLTPEVPGLTDAESIDRWDLPFETASKIRPQDDQYWNDYRTTPKAYVSLSLGQKLWNSRFGKVTSFRLPADYAERGSELVSAAISEADQFGLRALSIKRRGLQASAGSTPFDILFLALSMFVIGSALILIALLFRLSVQHRAAEIGILSATGWSARLVRRMWLVEMSLVAILGAGLGVLLGIAYAALMIWGLTTWWVDAISSPFLKLHLKPLALLTGGASGWLVSILTIGWSIQRALKQDPRVLLTGQLETAESPAAGTTKPRRRLPFVIAGQLLLGLSLALLALRLSGESQAGAFMGAGFLVLTAGLTSVYRSFGGSPNPYQTEIGELNLFRLARMNGRRNPLRSTLTIGLVAIASFLIAAVSSFRMSPTEQGTGGFDWVARSSQPIMLDLSTAEGRAKVVGNASSELSKMTVLPLRYQSGEDASCNNLYQSTQPQVLGIPQRFVEQFDPGTSISTAFGWAGSLAQSEAEQKNPWRLLASPEPHTGTAEDPIPAVIDKNTANYSLKIYRLNSIFTVKTERGQTIHFRIVGFLANTILQGSLLVGEKDFLSAYPAVGGYQYFLIREDGGMPGAAGSSARKSPALESPKPASAVESEGLSSSAKPNEILWLEDRLRDYGFEASSANQLLANFLKVQNTYLSTFQTLGSLGLLLGTFGLAVIQLRTVIERRREFGLLRAVGFSEWQLGRLIFLENLLLLGLGLGVGLGAALFAAIPHYCFGQASIPWLELGGMFGLIVAVGLMASAFASSRLTQLPLLESLRS